jgi:chaperonin GroEL (HSP60 family)
VTTVVLRAPCEPALQELEAATAAALAALTATLATPLALPGGGAVETMLAEHVRREAAKAASTRCVPRLSWITRAQDPR